MRAPGPTIDRRGSSSWPTGGTLYLDEIAEISPKIQVELLRVLEEKKVTRLGGSRSVPADFRTVAASSKNLHDEMQAGRFREDLYYRLNVFHITVPPLRERRQDIPILARAFTERLARAMNCSTPELRPEALDALVAHDWPGNVRELTNAIERAMVIRKGSEIRYEDLPIVPVTTPKATTPVDTHSLALSAVEKTHVARVLRACGWNISKTARVLKVDRATVYNKIRQYGLSRDQP